MQGTLLEISFPTIIIQIVNFVILLFFLNIFLYKPLKEAIASREKQVKDTLDEADSVNAQSLKIKEEYDEKMQNVKQEANQIIQTAVTEGQKMKTEIVEEGRLDVKHINERAFQEIERERKKTEESLKNEVASVAVEMATKILKDSLDERSQGAIVDEFTRRIISPR